MMFVTGDHLGWGLYQIGSLFNHSCAPNAEWHHRGSRLSVRSLVPLQPGAGLSISYLDLGAFDVESALTDLPDDSGSIAGSTSSAGGGENENLRREKLRRDYHFECACSRCSQGKTEDGEGLSEVSLVMSLLCEQGAQSVETDSEWHDYTVGVRDRLAA